MDVTLKSRLETVREIERISFPRVSVRRYIVEMRLKQRVDEWCSAGAAQHDEQSQQCQHGEYRQ